jgi:transcription initiation factor TFIID subunit 9B
MELAAEKNATPLPLIPERYGIRLPPEQYCLTGANFQIIPEVSDLHSKCIMKNIV